MTSLYVLVVALISLGALYELYCAFQRMGVRPSIWTGTLALMMLFVVAATDAPILALMGIVNAYLLVSLAQHLIRKDRTSALVDWAFSLSAVLYVGFTMMHFVLIVRIDGPLEPNWLLGAGGTALGVAWLGVALATTWTTEAVVWITGRLRGVRKGLADTRRPRSCALAGLTTGTVIGGLSGYLLGVPVSLAIMLLLGGIIAIGALFGDRCEALLKQQLGTSASVRSVPGRGGFLARIATLRVTVPLTFYMASLLQWRF